MLSFVCIKYTPAWQDPAFSSERIREGCTIALHGSMPRNPRIYVATQLSSHPLSKNYETCTRAAIHVEGTSHFSRERHIALVKDKNYNTGYIKIVYRILTSNNFTDYKSFRCTHVCVYTCLCATINF